MKIDKWMSDFYGIPWYRIDDINDAKNIKGPCLIECVINANEYLKINGAQEAGFVIVETAIEFETLIDRYDDSIIDDIRKANKCDLDRILEITKECYIEHDKFYNRFRNKKFFTIDQAWNYYRNSVINNFDKEDTLTVVVEDNKDICAYYILKKLKDLDLYGKYKGIIAGVTKKSRGNNLHVKMQSKLTDLIGKPYVTNNRTQLGNYRVIGNHLKEHRQLLKIEHICYLKKN